MSSPNGKIIRHYCTVCLVPEVCFFVSMSLYLSYLSESTNCVMWMLYYTSSKFQHDVYAAVLPLLSHAQIASQIPAVA